MTDKELLELAAKAAGNVSWFEDAGGWCVLEEEDGSVWPDSPWEPLDNDGDALRLAVKLNLVFEIGDDFVEVTRYYDNTGIFAEEIMHPDPYAATRRAIVRAAAEIGRGME